MKRACSRAWEVDALRDGRLSGVDAEAFARHAATCAECRAQRELDDRVQRAAGRLPTREHEVDALHVRRMRQRILELAGNVPPPRRPWPWLAAAIAIAVLVASAFGARSFVRRARVPGAVANATAEARPFGAKVDPASGARWSTERAGSTELVHLDDGTLLLEVRHREAGERFLVLLPDGEIEVKGTLFRVDVSEKRTRAVEVREGTVVLRRSGEPEVLLGAGERWSLPRTSSSSASSSTASSSTASSSSNASPSSTSRRAQRGETPASPRSGDAIVAQYEAALRLFDEHRFDDAARAFHTFAANHPRAEEADDATFLETMALSRAGHPQQAGTTAEAFLERYPRSIHARDAAVVAVRAAVARKDCARAQSLASQWLPQGAAREAASTCAQ